ncbi:MAG: signal peptide peptidase SppA [Phycisphaerales bacterium]|nr:MAG: signal peptide peptidase SppA [Phycisphaerales bacterium]
MSDTPPPPPGSPSPPTSRHLVHVQAKPGGFWRAISFVGALLLFLMVFIAGIFFGVLGTLIEPDVIMEKTYRDGDRNRIAILPIEGLITDRQARFSRSAVEHLLDDRRLRAVVLRVDSPGGGVTASDQIWYQVDRLRQAGIPVIASYGGVAASGGYYVSCHADHIVAETTSITGSIGVIAQIMTLEGLMDKVGIEPVTIVATGSPEKDVANNLFREWTENDRQQVLSIIDGAYETFKERVQNGRSGVIVDESNLAAVANGSVFTAQQALDTGLIDSIGYLDDAIAEAERQAGLTAGRSTVVRLSEPPTLFGDSLFLRRHDSSTTMRRIDGESLRDLVNDLATPRIMYLMR